MDSQNIHDCMRLADERGLGVNRMEDIILVTGRHLAKSWVRAVFSENRGGAQVSFVVNASGNSVLRLEERNVSGAQLKFGPNGEGLPENQCIFVRGYHVVRILNIWPKLRGLAGPAHLPSPEPDTDLELMGVPDDADDPLHTLLEYITEQTPSCDMVLVHDDDLKCIENAVPPLETLKPDALMGFLRDYAPTIRQFQ
ncbi:hypothetical protein BGY98DRAFT_716462 [Russula aff. rugulosa BPL654]|nr:hypothetical protein BGY98DRAFT_716462 [Russula aff. rugulosa BPL654]